MRTTMPGPARPRRLCLSSGGTPRGENRCASRTGRVHVVQANAGRGEGGLQPRRDPPLREIPEERLVEQVRRRGVEQEGGEDDEGGAALRRPAPGLGPG